MSTQQAATQPSAGERRRALYRRLLLALLFVTPSIGSWFSTNIVYAKLDEWQEPMRTEVAKLKTEMSDLERFVAQFQANELGRGTLNLMMAAVSADMKLRYLGDNLYRASSVSIGSLRRAAAVIYPGQWRATLKPYEDIIAQGYDSPEAVQQLQAFENKVIADALSTITRNQARIDALAGQQEGYDRLRRYVATSLAYLAAGLSIFLFVFKVHTSAPKPG